MIVSIRQAETSATAAITDGDDVSRLHVDLGEGIDVPSAGSALHEAGLGTLADADTAWISIAGIRDAMSGAAPDWAGRFAATLDYAATKGWLSADGESLQAHVVRQPSSGVS